MRVLLDTNVLIDFFGKRPAYYDEAVKLKAAAFFGDIEAWATANSLTDVFYVLSKNQKSSAIQKMFLASKDTLHICSVTPEDIYATAEQEWQDFEDGLVDICAQKLRADYLLTRDIKGFAQAKSPVRTPAEFLSAFEQETGISYAELIV